MQLRVPAVALGLIAALAVGIGVGFLAFGDDEGSGQAASRAKITGPLPERGGLEFVVQGPGTVDEGKLAIETDAVEWFTDTPKREAGVAEVARLAEAWDAYGFSAVPPNGAVAGGETEAVVEFEAVEATEDGIRFEFSPLEGELGSGDLGDVSAFIDSSSWNCYGDFYNRTDFAFSIDPSETDPTVNSAGWNNDGPPSSLPANDPNAPESAHMIFNANGPVSESAEDLGQGGGNFNPVKPYGQYGEGFAWYNVTPYSGRGDPPSIDIGVACKVDADGDVKFLDPDASAGGSSCIPSDDLDVTCSIERSDQKENTGKFFIEPK